MPAPLLIAAVILAAMLLGAAILHLLPRLGSPGRALAEWLSYAPGLDLAITYFTVAPLIAGPIAGVRLVDESGNPWLGGLYGLLAAIAGQVVAVLIWTRLHELANRQYIRGPRIVKVLNRKIGRWRNHAGVWWTTLAVPCFWIVRLAEIIIYPPLTWLVRLPRYRHDEWVNVSRHKFHRLFGHDLIWCLYCDWMTGVWSLGGEMLRNVESFWCPIRFASEKKCENCKHDFPDIESGWAPADSDMAEVARRLEEHYPGPGGDSSWWGHPARLTVGAPPPDKPGNDQEPTS